MRVVAYQVICPRGNGPVVIRDATGQIVGSSDPNVLLSFLRYRQRDVLRVFWDLDESIAPVLRLLPVPVLKRLAEFDGDLCYGEHQLYYLPERMFRIGRSRFYGIQGFWPSDTDPPGSLEELQDRAEDLVGTLERCGLSPQKLTSPIAIWEASEVGRRVYDSIPKAYDLPENVWEALEYAYQCDRREWISAYQLGHWGVGEIYDYDISSAYPGIAAELLDLRDFDVWKSDRLSPRELNALYGFMRGRLYLDPESRYAHASPFLYDLRIPSNPAGDLGPDYYMTLDEYRLLIGNDLGSYDFADGWFMTPRAASIPGRPFHDVMHRLYALRGVSPMAASIMKGIANQLIGKLIETRVDGSYGEIRNDIYHALILAKCRVRVARFLIDNEIRPDELVVVQTDGCRLTREIPTPASGMGRWRCNGSMPTIVASPYKVYSGDRKPGHLTYDHVVGMIRERPKTSFYSMAIKQRITLRQALQTGDISQVGNWGDLPAHLDLNVLRLEQNREFCRLPEKGESLLSKRYTSTAIIL